MNTILINKLKKGKVAIKGDLNKVKEIVNCDVDSNYLYLFKDGDSFVCSNSVNVPVIDVNELFISRLLMVV